MRTIARFKVAFVTLLTAIVLLVSARARAEFTPPPFSSSVVDQAGKLSAGEHSYLTAMIERHRRATGFVVAVYLPASLEGEPIEDVAYKTARAWKLGDQGKDNGVLLVIAPAERKIRIETGKGVGGALTDLQTNVILRERVGPQLKQDHFREAIAAGIDGIYAALAKDPSAAPVPQKRPGSGPQPVSGGVWFVLVPIFIFFFLFMMVMRFVSRLRGRRHRGYYDDRGGGSGGGTFIPPIIFPMGGGGGGSDWGGGGGGGDSGGGGGGDFGGGSSGDYGGGGDFGGGGSSDDY